VVILVQLTEAA